VSGRRGQEWGRVGEEGWRGEDIVTVVVQNYCRGSLFELSLITQLIQNISTNM
jgi:hypothetical protein